MSTMDDQVDARTTKRTPFGALVEVVGETIESDPFEAQAVDVSEEGMKMRTAYLPDVGQALVCRFDSGKESVTGQGEVVWQRAEAHGGEFGLKFTDLDDASEKALGKIITPAAAMPKGRVRLHIEGLATPMRANVKGSNKRELTVGSEFGFLQIGKQLELEDAETGNKRPATIDRVEVEIDPASQVPRLVVALKYDDEPEDESALPLGDEPKVVIASDAEPKGESQTDIVAASMKGTFARNAAKVTPAVVGFLKTMQARATEELAKRRGGADEEHKQKRMTSPPPGGGLHTSGRKVVRGAEEPAPVVRKFKIDKRRAALGGAAGLALVLVVLALRKPSTPPAPVATAELAPAVTVPQPLPVDPMLTIAAPLAAIPTVVMPMTEINPTPSHAGDKPSKVPPFTNGNVTHGNILRLKMDGNIEHINGAPQPTGFSVSIPGHKSLEPAGPLASRDGRIASIRVSNDPGGAMLDVAFKDGVPGYLVRAKGDTLEIVLAPIAIASHDPATPPKHIQPATAKKPPVKPPHNKH